MADRRHIDPLEPRRLFAFATFDADFGAGGVAAIDGAIDADATLTPLADGRLVLADRSAVRYRRGDGNADARRAVAGTLTPGAGAIAAGRGDDFVELAPRVAFARVLGEAGDDTILGGDGADTLSGGSGVDRIDGRGGRDWVGGDDDRDVLLGGDGDDTLRGGDGNDQLEGGDGADFLYGESDKDLLLGGDDPDSLEGNGGNDRLYASGVVASVGVDDGAPDTLSTGGGLDFLRVDAREDDFAFFAEGEDTLAVA